MTGAIGAPVTPSPMLLAGATDVRGPGNSALSVLSQTFSKG